jgi:hypothetical protein
MGIFSKRKKKFSAQAAQSSLEGLQDLPYAFEFDLPREEQKLRAVLEHEKSGGNFDIRKGFNRRGVGSRTIMTIAHFPTYDQLVRMVEEEFGGGTYSIHPAGGPRVFKTYFLDGPSRFLARGPKEKTPRQVLKERIEEQSYQYLEEQMEWHPEIAELVTRTILQKNLGIELPPPPSWEEQLFRKEIEKDQDLQHRYLWALLKKEGVEEPEEPDVLDQLIAQSADCPIEEISGGGKSAGRAGLRKLEGPGQGVRSAGSGDN